VGQRLSALRARAARLAHVGAPRCNSRAAGSNDGFADPDSLAGPTDDREVSFLVDQQTDPDLP
jgi:hypothetical protein